MELTQEQIEKLRTLQETYDELADILLADPVAKESTLVQGIQSIFEKVENIDMSAIEEKIDNIDLSPVEAKVDEGVATLTSKIDNIDLSSIKGGNPEATNSKILEEVSKIPNMARLYTAYAMKNNDGENTYTIVLPVSADIINGTTIKLQ